MFFTISADNNITAYDSREGAAAIKDVQVFGSEKELNKLAAEWPADRLITIWNSMAGTKAVKKFTSRKSGAGRIWKAIQSLGPVSTEEPPKQRARNAKKEAPPTKSREGSKKAQVIELLRRPDGASLTEVMEATSWQSHSVRGFISGALIRKESLPVESFKREDGQRAYRLPK